jgi:hypothetical protein
MKRGLKRIGKAILLTILVLVALVYAPFWDTAPPDVADLAVVRTEVPPEENAYTFFLQATNALQRNADFSFSRYLQGRTNDEAAVSAYITTNQAAIAWIRRGLECKVCQAPPIGMWRRELYVWQPPFFLDLGWLLAVQTHFERLQGRCREATDSCLLLLRFGDRLAPASDSIVEYLCANGIVWMGLEQAEELARDARCDAADRERLAARLAELSSADQGLVNAARGDYAISVDMLKQMRNGSAYWMFAGYWTESGFNRSCLMLITRLVCYPNYFMHYNRTRHLMADKFRLLIAHASSIYADHPLRDTGAAAADAGAERGTSGVLSRHSQAHQSQLPFANAMGLRIRSYIEQDYDSFVRNTCSQECALSGVRLILACRAYGEVTGRLPEALEDLVPNYLPAVPRDPFDGTPFRYSAERRLVYSVGENLVDDGGTDERQQGRRRAKDILFELER